MPKQSAGLILYRQTPRGLEVLLVHPGGPFFAKKDRGAWSIPKGEFTPPEQPLEAAIREFTEETGLTPTGPFHPLGSIRQSGGKAVTAFACPGDCDPTTLTSNLVRIEWPPRSGRHIEFPEIDRAQWFPIDEASTYINQAQAPLLQSLAETIQRNGGNATP
jgi:predicted NUDIX family NTP pyrophosphohydrolase